MNRERPSYGILGEIAEAEAYREELTSISIATDSEQGETSLKEETIITGKPHIVSLSIKTTCNIANASTALGSLLSATRPS